VGTGPYKLKEWADGTHAIFQANDRFVLGRPKIDEIEVKFIPDVNTLVSNLLAGALDVNVGRGLDLEQARQILERVEGSKTDNAIIGAFTLYPQFFMTDPLILLRVEMRRALLHAIDRQEMIDTLAFGQSTIAHTFIHDAEADYKAIEPSVVKYPFDPRRSAQLIEELGFRKGSDGFYRDAENQKLSFEVRTGRGTERLLSTVADYWQRIGVATDQMVIPPQLDRDVEYRSNFPAFEIVRRGNFRWDLRRVLSTAEAPLPETRYTGGNRGRYMNADFDAVLVKYDSTIPLEERTNILAQIVRHVSDNAVLMGLFHGLDATVYSKRLHNVHGKFERTTQAWNVHEWEVRS
jgi:peptide/nickel transport system substrate-binding protein